ncbi:MAG: sigma factor [Oscillospiraceae bacterium]|nr:sigma factor [Oscillospiraceae bacterium]
MLNGQPISDETVLLAQEGDARLRDDIIASSVPWVKKLVRKHTFILSVENTDEFSIALDALNTAIERFSAEKQIPFRMYASIIIRNRLIDWNRQKSSVSREQTFSDLDNGPIPYEDRLEDSSSGIAFADIESEDSMIEVEYRLSLFGLKLDGLVDHFPKQRPTLLFCVRAARALSDDRELFEKTMEAKRLPVSEIARRMGEPVKRVDKHRSCILLLAILLQSDLFLIRSYVAILEKEAKL